MSLPTSSRNCVKTFLSHNSGENLLWQQDAFFAIEIKLYIFHGDLEVPQLGIGSDFSANIVSEVKFL